MVIYSILDLLFTHIIHILVSTLYFLVIYNNILLLTVIGYSYILYYMSDCHIT
jgi:hypothetical protein